MEPIRIIDARCAVLPVDNIDTDQIIPARFLKTTVRAGLGRALFADWRYDAQGAPRPEFPLARPEAAGAAVLVAGDNFGCGSSREHAPWALADAGFRAVISTSIADIFRGNALKNGLLPVVVEPAFHRRLVERGSGTRIVVDLEACTVSLPDERLEERFPIDAFARHCLLHGVDELGFLLGASDEIDAFERGRGE
jgi:3-isopropylmalate/(R)-2-methylmalate dehydratase small subunit